MDMDENLALAHTIFESIQAAFPKLDMVLDEEPEHVDLMLTIPKQPGLAFPLEL